MKFPLCVVTFSERVSPAIFIETTAPSGEIISRRFLYIPFENVITRINLIAPTVDPLEPPISINIIIMKSTNGGHLAMTVEFGMLAPVVVMAETTVNNMSIGTIWDVKNINMDETAINEIITWNCKS